MGTTTDAHCFACGYDTFLSVGGGRANHATYAAWPVWCKTCGYVTTANFKKSPLVCGQCKGTEVIKPTDKEWWKGDGQIIERWGWLDPDALTLTSGHYRCPRCGEFQLRFGTDAGGHGRVMWD